MRNLSSINVFLERLLSPIIARTLLNIFSTTYTMNTATTLLPVTRSNRLKSKMYRMTS